MDSYTRKSIEEEYNTAARLMEEYEMVKWGSREKMYNRFKMALNYLDFKTIHSWLDVGSGTGAFQSVVCPLFPHLAVTGIDISKQLLGYARQRQDFDQSTVNFIYCDFLEFEQSDFDLITCVGVLQKTNISSSQFFEAAFNKLRAGGKLFLDTKNLHWIKFEEPNFNPEPGHKWFVPEDLIKDAQQAGFKEIAVRGFIPGTNEVVSPNDSHTIFLTAEK